MYFFLYDIIKNISLTKIPEKLIFLSNASADNKNLLFRKISSVTRELGFGETDITVCVPAQPLHIK